MEWWHFRWPWVTPDPGFKVTVVLKGEYLQSDTFYRHIYYIGRNMTPLAVGKLSIGNLAIQLTTTPLLLRKPCKLFASVARVCQRQLQGFLVQYCFCYIQGVFFLLLYRGPQRYVLEIPCQRSWQRRWRQRSQTSCRERRQFRWWRRWLWAQGHEQREYLA